MAYFNKYEAKANYVEKIMSENAEVESLTEEQHSTLAALCRIRHEIHTNANDFFYAESSNFKEFWAYIDDSCSQYGKLNEMLHEVDLPLIDIDISIFDYANDHDYTEYDMDYDEAFDEVLDMVEHLNDLIEDYLRKIDKEHGTHYAPTGHARNNF